MTRCTRERWATRIAIAPLLYAPSRRATDGPVQAIGNTQRRIAPMRELYAKAAKSARSLTSRRIGPIGVADRLIAARRGGAVDRCGPVLLPRLAPSQRPVRA